VGFDADSDLAKQICVVIPAFNEAENLTEVIPEIMRNLEPVDPGGYVLVVDDGSTDDTRRVMADLRLAYPSLRHERLNRNSGKAVALQRGFDVALEDGATVIIMMDADGQDDPAEIATLVQKLDSGFDLVTGSRINRQDRFIKRTTSRLFNRVTKVLSGAPGQDFNSGFKVMTAATAKDLSSMLYGEMHRYITVIVFWMGYRISDVSVNHRERMHGSTKYGLNRFWRGFMDLLTVRFLMSYQQRPSHLFGGIGLASSFLGSLILVYLLIEKIGGEAVGNRPMLTAAVLLIVVGLQLFLFGLLAEIIVYSRQRGSTPER